MISPPEHENPPLHRELISPLGQTTLMSESAKVVASFPGGAWVSVEPRPACHGCVAKQGCGSGLLALWQGERSRQLAVQSETPLMVGQRIRVAVPTTYFLWGTLLAYALPLMSAVSAGILAELLLSQGHWGVPVVFLAGLAAGAGLLKCCAGRLSRRLRPQVIDP